MEISLTADAGAASGTATSASTTSQLPGQSGQESEPKAISDSYPLEPSEVPLMKPGQLFYQNKSQTGFLNDFEQGS